MGDRIFLKIPSIFFVIEGNLYSQPQEHNFGH